MTMMRVWGRTRERGGTRVDCRIVGVGVVLLGVNGGGFDAGARPQQYSDLHVYSRLMEERALAMRMFALEMVHYLHYQKTF